MRISWNFISLRGLRNQKRGRQPDVWLEIKKWLWKEKGRYLKIIVSFIHFMKPMFFCTKIYLSWRLRNCYLNQKYVAISYIRKYFRVKKSKNPTKFPFCFEIFGHQKKMATKENEKLDNRDVAISIRLSIPLEAANLWYETKKYNNKKNFIFYLSHYCSMILWFVQKRGHPYSRFGNQKMAVRKKGRYVKLPSSISILWSRRFLTPKKLYVLKDKQQLHETKKMCCLLFRKKKNPKKKNRVKSRKKTY